jgi:hypothetical protein
MTNYLFIYYGAGIWTQIYTLSHSTNSIFVKNFQDRVSQTVCPGWLWTVNLLNSASWEARITGMSHQHRDDLLCTKLLKILHNTELYIFTKKKSCWEWWHMPVILTIGRWTQKDLKFEGCLGYMVETMSQKKFGGLL